MAVKKCFFFPDESRFAALSELHEDQRNGAPGAVADQPQPLGFQSVFLPTADQLCQTFRLVDKEKVAAKFDGISCGVEQFVDTTAIIPPGKGRGFADRSAGKIGRIGHTALKAAGGDDPGKPAQIGA